MKLMSIKYSQFEGESNEWNLDRMDLGETNLIVGKNATGKTKTINLINTFAKLLCGELKLNAVSVNFHAIFKSNEKNYQYLLRIKNSAVEEEIFKNDTIEFLVRGQDGVGKIWAEKQKDFVEFQTPTSELAIFVRRDSIQHPYITPLYDWAKSVYYYAFGTQLGKNIFPLIRRDTPIEINIKDTEAVVGIFYSGYQNFGDAFKQAIINDMKSIDYDISDVGLGSPSYMTANMPTELMGLWVQEDSLKNKTEQSEMSQGMFRALSLVTQLNYSKMALTPSCILIDDIGEGLDFERSCALIDLLMQKAEASKIQLVMATNDRFVMNKVPLEKWTVLQREGACCRVFNIKNSKEKFEDFRFTGLNNFDFFATDYLAESET